MNWTATSELLISSSTFNTSIKIPGQLFILLLKHSINSPTFSGSLYTFLFSSSGIRSLAKNSSAAACGQCIRKSFRVGKLCLIASYSGSILNWHRPSVPNQGPVTPCHKLDYPRLVVLVSNPQLSFLGQLQASV